MGFQIKYKNDQDKDEIVVLGCESKDEYDTWTEKLKNATRMEIPSMKLGGDVAELRKFVVSVKNRRQKVAEDAKEQFAPVYKSQLWKLKALGDKLKPDDWFEREMWIAKNGSLCYYSKKEERDIVYYTAGDLLHATCTKAQASDVCKPFAFLVNLPKSGEVEFEPGCFAASTEAFRDRWIQELEKFSAGSKS